MQTGEGGYCTTLTRYEKRKGGGGGAVRFRPDTKSEGGGGGGGCTLQARYGKRGGGGGGGGGAVRFRPDTKSKGGGGGGLRVGYDSSRPVLYQQKRMGGDRCQNSRPVFDYLGEEGGRGCLKCCRLLHKTSTISILYLPLFHTIGCNYYS